MLKKCVMKLANIIVVMILSNDISILKYEYISKSYDPSYVCNGFTLEIYLIQMQSPIHTFTVGGIHVSSIWNSGTRCFKRMRYSVESSV